MDSSLHNDLGQLSEHQKVLRMADTTTNSSSVGIVVGQSEEGIWSSMREGFGIEKTSCLAAAYFFNSVKLNQNSKDYADLSNEIHRSELDSLFKEVLDDIALLCARYKNMKRDVSD